jgi:hypothetical protein
MEPLPISTMDIRVYDKEESPLHQIVKKLIWKKILDLEPYNFNYISTYNVPGLHQAMYGGCEDSKKCQEIRETMTWDHSCMPQLIDHIKERDEYYDPDPFQHASRRPINFIPLHSYQDRVFQEYAVEANGVKIVPDIALMDEKYKPETVIEIIYTGIPDSTKIINLVESDLNVIFVIASEAIEELSMDMTCRRSSFRIPIREAWHGDTPTMEKLSRAVNILLQKKMYTPKEYIISKKIITNTQWLKGSLQWRKSRMKVGLKITTNEGERDLSHSMIQMKETSTLIKLLRHIKKLQKQEKELDDGMNIPVLEGAR